ncbi:hypothetical protein ScPMuIL_010398 [Solemya velum]
MSTLDNVDSLETLISPVILRMALYGHWRCSSVQDPYHAKRCGFSPATSVPTPRQVRVSPSSIPGSKYGIFSTNWIRSGTEMGPFMGSIIRKDEMHTSSSNNNVWEVFDENGDVLYYLDGGTSNPTSWLSLVQCARTEQEQNLEIFQLGRDIYYRATKDIPPDQELLVWYGASHNLYMGIPCAALEESSSLTKTRENCPLDARAASPTATPTKLKCVLCRRGFNSRSNLRSHMRIHTLERPFACKYCNRKFSQSSTLRNHVRLHTGEKPYKCVVCKSSYSQLAGLRAHQRSARHRPLVTN